MKSFRVLDILESRVEISVEVCVLRHTSSAHRSPEGMNIIIIPDHHNQPADDYDLLINSLDLHPH